MLSFSFGWEILNFLPGWFDDPLHTQEGVHFRRHGLCQSLGFSSKSDKKEKARLAQICISLCFPTASQIVSQSKPSPFYIATVGVFYHGNRKVTKIRVF